MTTPVFSPVQPTKGVKLESKLDLGVIEEDEEEDEEDVELVVNALGTSELPVVTTSIGSLPVCTGPPIFLGNSNGVPILGQRIPICSPP